MALISCPECSGKLSTAAPACPHCGYPAGGSTSPTVVTCQHCSGHGNCGEGFGDRMCSKCRKASGTWYGAAQCTVCGGAGKVRL